MWLAYEMHLYEVGQPKHPTQSRDDRWLMGSVCELPVNTNHIYGLMLFNFFSLCNPLLVGYKTWNQCDIFSKSESWPCPFAHNWWSLCSYPARDIDITSLVHYWREDGWYVNNLEVYVDTFTFSNTTNMCTFFNTSKLKLKYS